MPLVHCPSCNHKTYIQQLERRLKSKRNKVMWCSNCGLRFHLNRSYYLKHCDVNESE